MVAVQKLVIVHVHRRWRGRWGGIEGRTLPAVTNAGQWHASFAYTSRNGVKNATAGGTLVSRRSAGLHHSRTDRVLHSLRKGKRLAWLEHGCRVQETSEPNKEMRADVPVDPYRDRDPAAETVMPPSRMFGFLFLTIV